MSLCRQHSPKARGQAGQVRRARVELFNGLYDGNAGRSLRPVFRGALRRQVRLLNPEYGPEYGEDDATARRFSLLEIE